MWRQVSPSDEKALAEYLGLLQSIRSYYGKHTLDDLKALISRKQEIEGWIYDGRGFQVFVCCCWSTGKQLYRVLNAGAVGSINGTAALPMIVEKIKDYMERHGAKRYFIKVPKDLLTPAMRAMATGTGTKIANMAYSDRFKKIELSEDADNHFILTCERE